MNNKERFVSLCASVKRKGISELLEWLGKSDFYTAPASTRFHGSYEGGLVQHSLNVYDELKRLLSIYPEIECSEETAVIISLFHDLCKVNFYGIDKRNRKTNQVNGRVIMHTKLMRSFALEVTEVSLFI